MALTITPYDHTALRFANGSNVAGDTYKVMLCTAATFDATDTTLAGITKTEVAEANGYTTGGETLSNVAITAASTNGAKFDADDVTWSASPGPITAEFAIIYNDTDADDPPLAFIDFGEEESAANGTDFLLVWSASGIFTWSVV
jgi:hypothetical protein